jgi:osmotically-inducible protein OsmY
VDDSVLADRIRSTIGPLEKQLHVSRINVTVENGVAILHGDVASSEAATRIAEAVRGIAGVREVRSHLTH